MNTNDANGFVRAERARWLPGRDKSSDAEILRQREKLFNALAMLFALIALVSFFCAGVLGWGVWGWYFAVVGAIVTARQCSAHANRCREIRESLHNRTMNSVQQRSALDARTLLCLHMDVHWPGGSESER